MVFFRKRKFYFICRIPPTMPTGISMGSNYFFPPWKISKANQNFSNWPDFLSPCSSLTFRRWLHRYHHRVYICLSSFFWFSGLREEDQTLREKRPPNWIDEPMIEKSLTFTDLLSSLLRLWLLNLKNFNSFSIRFRSKLYRWDFEAWWAKVFCYFIFDYALIERQSSDLQVDKGNHIKVGTVQ